MRVIAATCGRRATASKAQPEPNTRLRPPRHLNCESSIRRATSGFRAAWALNIRRIGWGAMVAALLLVVAMLAILGVSVLVILLVSLFLSRG